MCACVCSRVYACICVFVYACIYIVLHKCFRHTLFMIVFAKILSPQNIFYVISKNVFLQHVHFCKSTKFSSSKNWQQSGTYTGKHAHTCKFVYWPPSHTCPLLFPLIGASHPLCQVDRALPWILWKGSTLSHYYTVVQAAHSQSEHYIQHTHVSTQSCYVAYRARITPLTPGHSQHME